MRIVGGKGKQPHNWGLPRSGNKPVGRPALSKRSTPTDFGKAKFPTRSAPGPGSKTFQKLKSKSISKWATIAPRLTSAYKGIMQQKKISTSPYRIRLRRNK